MRVSAIVAAAQNWVIGQDNQIPWHLPADLRYFRDLTLHHYVIMGRKTFQSMGKPLVKRSNVIITRDPFYISSNCQIARSIEEALQMAIDADETEAFIIGGAEIFRLSMQLWDRLYLTEVDLQPEGDIVMPQPDWSEWTLISEEAHFADEKNPANYIFKVFDKIA
ncbi:MAG: dihydrofolate reductase [Saprospiraceae bacterium]